MDASPLTLRLKAGTAELHLRAERSGIMRELLRGELQRDGYCRLLRNLHPVYSVLEHALEPAPSSSPMLMSLGRAGAIARDLDDLHGPAWREEIAVMPACERYVHRLALLQADQPWLLAAHAYVRYLGDLNGGQILRALVTRSLGLAGRVGTAFFDFSPAKPGALARHYREALDSMALNSTEAASVVDEARLAFALNIELFEQLGSWRND